MSALGRALLTCCLLSLFTPGLTQLSAQENQTTVIGKIVKEIRLEGIRHTKLAIVNRELKTRVGHPYLKEQARADLNRLNNLDLTSEIQLEPVLDGDGVILVIRALEIFPYLPFLSYEITDENGFSAGPGIQSINMFGRDIFLASSARFGGATNIGLLLEDPWVGGNHLSYSLELFRRERFSELDDFNEEAFELYLTLGSYLGQNGRVGARFSLQSIKSDKAGITLSENNEDTVPTAGFFLGYDSRDLWANPSTGWLNEIEVSKAGGFVGGDSDFWRLNLDLRRYLPLRKRHTLALFSLTTLTSGTVGEDLALWQDFSLGGTNSVRGWELDSRSGKNQVIKTAEYRVTVLDPKVFTLPFGISFDIGVQLTAFGDLGLAWDDADAFDLDNSIGGYGLGFRFLVPFVNMFRFDFAKGESGESFSVHIGAFSKAIAQRFRVR